MPVVLAKATISPDHPILRVAERLEGRLRLAVLNAIAAVRDQVVLDKLARAIEAGEINDVLAILAIDERFTDAMQGKGLEPRIISLRQAILDTFEAGAGAALQSLPREVAINTSFNLLNPEAVNFLNTYSFNLIKQISSDVRDAIQNTILRGFQDGVPPVAMAREIRDSIGLTARMERAVQNYRAALEGGDLKGSLTRALRDGRYDRSVLTAIKDNASLSQSRIGEMVARYRERFIAQRAKNIARTESIRASAAGQIELWRQARAQGNLPDDIHKRWVAVGDDRTCPQCMDLDGETIELDEEFDPGVMAPPLHTICRCAMSLVFQARKFEKAGFDPNQARDDQGQWSETGGDLRRLSDAKQALRLASEGTFTYGSVVESEYKKQEKLQRANSGGLTPDAHKSLDRYIGSDYQVVNDILRDKPRRARSKTSEAEARAIAHTLKEAVEHSPLPNDMVMFRGASLRDEDASNLKPGAIVSDKGFISATMNLTAATAFTRAHSPGLFRTPTLMRIEAPKGTPALLHNRLAGEDEVLLAPGSKFKVLHVQQISVPRYKHSIRVVWMKYLGDTVTVSKRMPSLLTSLLLESAVRKEFDPNQARDYHGRWTDVGALKETPFLQHERWKGAKEGLQHGFVELNDGYHEAVRSDFDKLAHAQHDGQNPLTLEQIQALNFYHGEGLYSINTVLRNPTNEVVRARVTPTINTLQNLILHNHLPQDMVVFRGAHNSSGLKTGAVFTDKGFVSTTLNTGVATAFSSKSKTTIVRIEAAKGLPGYLHTGSHDSEVLLPHGSQFKVADVHDITVLGHNVRVVWAKYIGVQ